MITSARPAAIVEWSALGKILGNIAEVFGLQLQRLWNRHGASRRSGARFLRRHELRNPKLLPALLGVPKVVLRLLVEPTLGGGAKGHGKTDCHLRADPSTAIQNGREGLTTYSQSLRGLRN